MPFTQPAAPADGLPSADSRRIRRAVLAGVGEARNWPDEGADLTGPVPLALSAARAAAEHAGNPNLLESVGLVAMTVGSDDVADPAAAVREELDLAAATTMVAAIGIPQQRLVSNALLAVECGHADAVLVIGAEAKASALAARRSGGAAPVNPGGPGADITLAPDDEFMAETEVSAMLWDAVAQYALIDSALALAEGRSPHELLREASELWARFDAVAETNPNAAFTGLMHSADSLATTTEENRLLAFPYNKWHSTQWAVDHAAALLICSEDLATRRGVAEQDMLHPHVALDSSWGLTLSRRPELHRWPAIGVMGDVAAEHLGVGVAEVDLVELYSCFPAAVRVQQRELGMPLDGTPTELGGMAFAGGPFNHFTYMATAELARRLRDGRGDTAALTTVSGLLTKAGLMVWGREPHGRGALVADVATEAEATTGSVEVADFDPDLSVTDAGEVLAATITGGFNPSLFAITRHDSGIRHVVSDPVPDGDPADRLAELTT